MQNNQLINQAVEGGNIFDDITGSIGNVLNTGLGVVKNVANTASSVLPLAPLLLAAGAHINRIEKTLNLNPITKGEAALYNGPTHGTISHKLSQRGIKHHGKNIGKFIDHNNMTAKDKEYLINLLIRAKRVFHKLGYSF